jgi:uncharacterized protein (TIGR00255 family)
MTGYARAADDSDTVVETKSVNGRGLDVRLRLPAGHDALELPLRQMIQTRFKRGSITLTLTAAAGTAKAVTLNRDMLDAVIALRNELAGNMPLAPSTIEGLLALRGMGMGMGMGADPGQGEVIDEARVMVLASQALDALAAMREAEGLALAAVMRGQIDRIAQLAGLAAQDPSLAPDAILARLSAQLALFSQAGVDIDPQRLAAEAALLATKADIREELDRLAMHCAAIRQLIDSGDAIGRKLDFMAQELNREANTLCSKSSSSSLTTLGVELKVLIDQFREQAQNVE